MVNKIHLGFVDSLGCNRKSHLDVIAIIGELKSDRNRKDRESAT